MSNVDRTMKNQREKNGFFLSSFIGWDQITVVTY